MVAWTSIAALSVFVSYLITFLLGIVGFLFGLLMLISMLKSGLSLFGVILAVFALIMGGTTLWSLLPRKLRFEVNGVPIDMSRETRLHAEIEALARALNENMPDEVYLVPFANAAVLEHKNKRIMLLGLPLLELLTVSQFRAILAHEFGHFYAGDTRMSPWLFRARRNMADVLTRLSRDSELLSFLSQFVVVAILRMAILGVLTLWWKLFNRLTQHISRKQEYRCDELACYLAGSESLEKGLCSVSRAAATFAPFLNQVVAPIVASGYRPPLADGYGRLFLAPEVAKVASALLEAQLATNRTDPMDSHPPLNARIKKARTLAITIGSEDNRPAIALLENLPWLELQLLTKLMPALKPTELNPIEWDNAGSIVYVPLLRRDAAKLAPALDSVTIYDIPKAISRIGNRIPDPPGTLLTHEQRAGRAVDLIGRAMMVVLVDHGWKLHYQPGQCYVESENGITMDQATVIKALRNGNQGADTWLQFCQANGIGDWQMLAPEAAQGAAQ